MTKKIVIIVALLLVISTWTYAKINTSFESGDTFSGIVESEMIFVSRGYALTDRATYHSMEDKQDPPYSHLIIFSLSI